MTYNVFSGTLNPTHFTSPTCPEGLTVTSSSCELVGPPTTEFDTGRRRVFLRAKFSVQQCSYTLATTS